MPAVVSSEIPIVPALVLVVSDDDDDDSSSGSISEERHSLRKAVSFDDEKQQGKDSGIDCAEVPFIPPDAETAAKIREAVEYYLSDTNVLKDTFLLKHLRRNKEGYVSLKLISSFRKVKSLSRNWKAVSFSLRESKLLALNTDETKIRRLTPLPDHDETASSRTVVVYNLPDGRNITVISVNDFFSKCGDINLIRVLKPGGSNSLEIKKFFAGHPDLQSKECGLIEFEQYTSAKNALEMNTDIDVGLKVLPLVTKDEDKTVLQSPIKSSPLRESPKKKRKCKRSQYGSKSNLSKYGDSESDVSTRQDPIFRRGSYGYNSSSSSGYLSSSPNDSRFPRRHSYNPSGMYLESSSSSFASLNNRGNYNKGSRERLNKNDTDKNHDSSGSQSPWRRRREMLLKSESASASSCFTSSKISSVKTIRLPIGPDGTTGFKPRSRARLPSTAE